jgi:arginyl-tRNA synthetase
MEALQQCNEERRVLLTEETQKYERMLRDRNASTKNLTEAESGVRRQGVELSARDGTIIKLKEQLDKVTNDSIKKSTKTEDLRGDSSKKAAKIEDLRNQRTGLRNRLVELDNSSASALTTYRR